MAAFLVSFLLFLDYFPVHGQTEFPPGWDYGQIWCDILICGTEDKKYPFCCEMDESPIDFQDMSQSDQVCEDELDWDYDGSSKWRVIKKEHTIEVEAIKTTYNEHGEHETVLNTGENYIASFENPVDKYPAPFAPGCYDEQIDLIDDFCFAQMHFHWGLSDETGSEHFEHGHQYPMEVHFVHFNCETGSVQKVQEKYPTKEKIEEARCSGEDVHELAVIGVWFEITEYPNPVIARILDAVDEIKRKEESECEQSDTGVGSEECEPAGSGSSEDISVIAHDLDLRKILTPHIQEGGFYTYEGSLTTPPCTTDVRWFMMKEKAHIGVDQIERFRQITRPCSDKLIAPNYRPLQDNPSPVFECLD